MDLVAFGVILPWFIIALGCWLGYQLVRQNGRILLHLDALEQRLAQLAPPSTPAPVAVPGPPPGLPVGSPAPEFELPDLAGGRRALADFRGRRVLLIFFNPRCGFCTQMAPDLAQLPTDGAQGRPLPLVVSTGGVEENHKLVAEHGIRCPVALQQPGTREAGGEVASRYQAHGTPMGYLIDERGHIASEIAVGSRALLALADPSALAAGVNGHKAEKGNRSLTDSKLNRNGLAAGTRAPNFTLPALDGSVLCLEEYRGRKVLLVFSDPNRGPCDALAPKLEEFHRRSGDVQVLMISRGDAEANRAKAAEHEVTFPIVLQKQWEISRLYGMFATPIGYLIDENGVIAGPVGVGVEPILAHFSRAEAQTNGKGDLPPARPERGPAAAVSRH